MSDTSLYNLGLLYLVIPTEFECTYKRLCVLMADYGEEMLKDCKANCTEKNVQVIECFNMFNSAIAAKNKGNDKLAFLIIKYINAKLNNIYGYDNSSELCNKITIIPDTEQPSPEQPSNPLPDSLLNIGYTALDLDCLMGDTITYTTEVLAKWNNKEITTFDGDTALVYAPVIDLSDKQTSSKLFNRCSNLVYVPSLDCSPITDATEMFAYCGKLKHINTLLFPNCTSLNSICYHCYELESIKFDNTKNVTDLDWAFSNCKALKRIEGLDITKVTSKKYAFDQCNSLRYLDIIGLGHSSITDFSDIPNWGTGGEENKQSLLNSLLVNSAQLSTTITIKLSANTKAVLTEEEIISIENRGYIIQ